MRSIRIRKEEAKHLFSENVSKPKLLRESLTKLTQMREFTKGRKYQLNRKNQ